MDCLGKQTHIHGSTGCPFYFSSKQDPVLAPTNLEMIHIYYSGLPDKNTAEILIPFLNTAIDNPILKHLKKLFPDRDISPKTVEQIDATMYKRLQDLIKVDIERNFKNNILPTQYDDIMWNRLNRKN